MKRNDMPCSPGCRSECFIHAEHSGLHLTPNSPRTITHQPKTDTSKTNQRPTERRLQQTLDRNWLCDQWLSLMELSTTWRNSCDTTNILKDWLTSLDLNFTTTISNQNLKFREERYIEDHLSLNTFIARTMCQVLVQVLSNLNSFTMEFCEMGVLCTISEMKKRWVLIRACLRSQAVKGWRGSQDHAHHTVPRHGPHALALLAEVSLTLFYVRSTRRAASSTRDSEAQDLQEARLGICTLLSVFSV